MLKVQRKMFPQRKPIKPPEENGCTIEIKRTKGGGKKIKISKNCSRDQIKMLQESGEIKLNNLED